MEQVVHNITLNNMNLLKQRSKSLDFPYEKGNDSSSTEMSNKDIIRKTKYTYKKKPIGAGSFAKVYLAKNSEGNYRALKSIDLSIISDEKKLRVVRELEISKEMNHPNVVQCFEVIKTDKQWFIVCEYCNAGTFSEIIKQFKNLDNDMREAYGHYYLTQLKDALQYLHNKNIIHRDLKPANILVTRKKSAKYSINNEVVKLADFGLARYFEQETDTMNATICGTPIYMSPELVLHNKYNIKADLWSFGVIMYEMMYATNPYNYPKTTYVLIDKMKNAKIPFKNTLTPQCIDLLQKLLQVDHKKRISWEDFFVHDWFSMSVEFDSDSNNEVSNDSNNEVSNDSTNNSINNSMENNTTGESQLTNHTNDTTDAVLSESGILNEDGVSHSDIIINHATANLSTLNDTKDMQIAKNTTLSNTESTDTVHKDPERARCKSNEYKVTKFSDEERSAATTTIKTIQADNVLEILKNRNQEPPKIKGDLSASPYSSSDIKKEKEKRNYLYELSESFIDKHFSGDGNVDEDYDIVGDTNKTNENKTKTNESKTDENYKTYKESMGSSMIRLLGDSVGFLYHKSGNY